MHNARNNFCLIQQLLLVIGLFATLIFARPVRAGEIVVVLSGDAEPYKQAEASLRTAMSTGGNKVRTVQLTDLGADTLGNTIGKDVSAVAAVGTPAATWLHQNLPAEKPLVYCMVGNPSAAALDHGRPTWGVSTDVPLSVQFALIGETLPRAHVIGMLCHTETPQGKQQIQAAKDALPQNWQLEVVSIEQQQSVADAINALLQKSPDVVWTTPDSSIYDSAVVRALLLASLRAKIPVFGFSPAFVRAGAVLGVGVSPTAQGSQAAELLLARMADPQKKNAPSVFAPTQYQIAVNLIVADQLDLKVPDSVIRKSTFQYQSSR